MTSKLNSEVIERVKEMVEELGYVLQVDYDSIHDVKYEPIDKRAYIMSITDLNEIYLEDGQNKIMPYSVITFSKSSSEELKDVAIVLFDVAKMDCGSVKLIDASSFSLNSDYGIPFIQDLVYHDAFPGEDRLRFPVDEDLMDDMDNHWGDYVKIIRYQMIEKMNYSWFPNDYCFYLPKREGMKIKEIDCFETAYMNYMNININNHYKGPYEGKIFILDDLKSSKVDYKIDAYELPNDRKGEDEYYILEDKEAIIVSLSDSLRPTLLDAKDDVVYVPLSQMAVIDMSLHEEYNAEYLVKELQKDYVAKQIEDRERTDCREIVLSILKIYIPLDLCDMSSKERQKIYVQKEQDEYVRFLEDELQKEHAKYLKEYKEVCEYCKKEILKELLIALEKNKLSYKSGVLNQVRQLVGWVKRKSPGCLKKYKDEKMSLSDWSRAIAKDDNIPEYIKRSFHTCVRLGNEGSHDDDDENENEDKILELKKAPYLNKSAIYSLLNILYWCKDLENGNGNV